MNQFRRRKFWGCTKSLFPGPQLVDHPVDLGGGWSRRPGLQELEGIQILCPEGFLACFGNHPTLHPHFHFFVCGQVGAFGDKY